MKNGVYFLAVNILFLSACELSPDPFAFSETKFKNIYKNEKNYSYLYLNDNKDIIFICMDTSKTVEENKKNNCKGNRRFVRLSNFDVNFKNKLLTEIDKEQ